MQAQPTTPNDTFAAEMVSHYFTSKELCERFKCSVRTLHRWMEREKNPLPPPTFRPSGTHNLWADTAIFRWEESLAAKA